MSHENGGLGDPNRIVLCDVCGNRKTLRARDMGFKIWYIASNEGHEACSAEIERRRIEERERQEVEKRLAKDAERIAKIASMIEDGFDDSGLCPERRSFADLKTYSGNAKAVERATSWKFSDPGFCLYGPPGTGKSHIIAAIAQTIPERFDARFKIVRWGRWVKGIYADSFAGSGVQSTLLREAPVLFLDDIGAEKITEHSESILDDIIHEREEFRRPTFMTTNLNPEGLEKLLTPRLWSRMQSLMDFIPVGGKDIRKAKGAKK